MLGPLIGEGRSRSVQGEGIVSGVNVQTTSHNDSIVIYRHRPEFAVILIITHGDVYALDSNSSTADYLDTRLYQVKARLTRK